MARMAWDGADGERARRRWWTLIALGALALALALIALLAAPTPEERALGRMAPDERQAVYARGMENLRVLCGEGRRSDALEQECAEQIRFLLQFPECDEACRAIARLHQPRPTK
jgi:hypothetical protein